MPKSESSPVVSHKPPAVGKGGVSSARERRRRNKQEGGVGGRGRVVLKSRSAADLCKKEDKKRNEVDFATPPGSRREMKEPTPPKKESSNDRNEREPNSIDRADQSSLRVVLNSAGGNDEPDSGPIPPQPSKQQQEQVNRNNEADTDIVASSRKEAIDSQQQKPRWQPHVSVGQKLPRARRVKSDSDSAEAIGDGAAAGGGGGAAVLNGQSSDEVEVEEFFTLLDTTLHLPEDSPLCPAPFDGGDRPGPPLAAFSVVSGGEEEEEGHHQRTLPPGRLADRIKALRE